MNERSDCVVLVADGVRARLFTLERDADLQCGARLREVEDWVNTDYTARGTDAPQMKTERNTSRQAGPMHPQGAERQWHRSELARRFAHEVTNRTVALIKAQHAGALVVVAEPKMLGHVRGPLHDALAGKTKVSEWGRNYTNLAPDVLFERLSANHLLPGIAVAG